MSACHARTDCFPLLLFSLLRVSVCVDCPPLIVEERTDLVGIAPRPVHCSLTAPQLASLSLALSHDSPTHHYIAYSVPRARESDYLDPFWPVVYIWRGLLSAQKGAIPSTPQKCTFTIAGHLKAVNISFLQLPPLTFLLFASSLRQILSFNTFHSSLINSVFPGIRGL